MNMLKATLFVTLCICSFMAKADSIETVFGGLTYHLQNTDGVDSLLSNKISNDGRLIYTGLLGIGLSSNNWNARIFVGENSIAEPIFGSTLSYTWKFGPFGLGPAIGFYQQDDSKFLAKGISPFSVGFGIVPIVGAEFSAKLLTFDNNKFIKSNTLITPVIINQTISIGLELW